MKVSLKAIRARLNKDKCPCEEPGCIGTLKVKEIDHSARGAWAEVTWICNTCKATVTGGVGYFQTC